MENVAFGGVMAQGPGVVLGEMALASATDAGSSDGSWGGVDYRETRRQDGGERLPTFLAVSVYFVGPSVGARELAGAAAAPL